MRPGVRHRWARVAVCFAPRVGIGAILSLFALWIAIAPAPAWSRTLSPEQTAQLAQRFAACIVKQMPSRAWRLIVEHDRTQRDVAQRLRFDDINCLREVQGGLRFPLYALHYVLARELFMKYLAAGPVPAFEGVAPLDHRPPDPLDESKLPPDRVRAAELRQSWQLLQVGYVMSRYTECIVRQNPQATFSWLRTADGSAEAQSAIDALRPALAGCLPAGETARVSREGLRSALTLSYARLAVAANPALMEPASAR